MTNTRTRDLETTVAQIRRLEEVGCEIVRVAVLNREDAEALKVIKSKSKFLWSPTSISITASHCWHWQPALTNPHQSRKHRRQGTDQGGRGCLAEKRVPIRIGVNAGSLERHPEKHGSPTAEALVESAERHVRILEELDFRKSSFLKASDVERTVRAYELASERLLSLHIGVTEAGSLRAGTIRSSIGLGILLHKGIGDTIRVSLSADPTKR